MQRERTDDPPPTVELSTLLSHQEQQEQGEEEQQHNANDVVVLMPRILTDPSVPDPPSRFIALALLCSCLCSCLSTWFSASAVMSQLVSLFFIVQDDQEKVLAERGSMLTIFVQLGFVCGGLLSALVNLADVFPSRVLMLVGGMLANACILIVGENFQLLPSDSAGVHVSEGAMQRAKLGFYLVLALRFVTGASLALVYPTSVKHVATYFRRGRGFAVGCLIGALVFGTALPNLITAASASLHWRTVVVVSSLCCLGGAVLGFSCRAGPFPFPRSVVSLRQVPLLVRNAGVMLAILAYVGHQWELYAAWANLQRFFAVDVFGGNQQLASWMTFFFIASGALGCLLGGFVADRIGRTLTALLSLLISGTCSLLVGVLRFFGAPLPLLLAVCMLWGLTIVSDSALFSAMVTETADAAYVGTALSVQFTLGFLMTIPSIALIPMLTDALTWTWVFAVLAPGAYLGALALVLLRRHPDAKKLNGGKM